MANPLDDLVSRMKVIHEKRTVPAQAKLTNREIGLLDDLVKYCRSHGIPDATRSSVMRGLIVDGLDKYRDEHPWQE